VLHGNAANPDSIPEFGLFVVADGMGGHRAGEVASAISVRKVAQRVLRDSFLNLFETRGNSDGPSLQELVREALKEANEAVVQRVPGGGTTVTAMVLLGKHVTFGHVGDSRAYAITEEETKAITRDHSLVERLKELGQLSDEEAAVHPQRNVLYRAIGQGANLEVDVYTLPVPTNGYLLLCSDGLWGVIPEAEIRHIVLSAETPQVACEQLVQAANAAGGPDNITAILVYFPPE
jgi:protein phosphatase